MSDVTATLNDDTGLIPLTRLAAEAGMHQYSMKKAVIRAGLKPVLIRIAGRKQWALSRPDADKFLNSRTSLGVTFDKETIPEGIGGVYLVRPDPQLRPKRVKVGWANSFKERLDTHRCLAPELEVVRLYITKFPWTEQMTVLALEKIGQRVSQEIFDLDSLDNALAIVDQQFDYIQVPRVEENELT